MPLSAEDREMLRKMNLGVKLGVAHALAEHKKAGRSIVIARDGKVVKVPPDEIQVPKINEK